MTCAAVKFERLPEFAKPTHYNIKLTPDLKTFEFHGDEKIDLTGFNEKVQPIFQILKATDYLKLHASEINIKQAALKLADGTIFHNLSVNYDKQWTTVTVKLPKSIDPQNANLLLKFVGTLNDKMRGFYRSSYKDMDGKQQYIATTQFESTYARLAFPCWDEPVYKAKFDITLEVDDHYTALSNMNTIDEQVKNGKKIVKYATTPLMSTYLIAFAVGDFEFIESKTKSGCITRLYTVPGKTKNGEFALNLGTKAIDWYNDWFGITYPLPKCDLIAIPDFSNGAMENWGLVTYREVALLVDEAKSSTRQKSRVALIVAHELAHLWFGDLVTMKWWTDLWLKEGFASFMEYMFVGSNYPEYKIWLHFVNDEMAPGFGLDSLRSSHPIEIEIDNPNELDEIYDNITYAKSNSVNRMLCNYLGEKTFQKGLQMYLRKFQYSNALTNDLWDMLSEASGQDIGALMSTWTKQMGFPLVSVSQVINGNKRTLKLKQARFLADGGLDENNQLWQVPVTISTSADSGAIKHRFLLTKREQEVTFDDIHPNDWVKINAGTTGFYRVEYSPDMLEALLRDVSSKKLPAIDRYGMTDDLFALVKAGRICATQFLSFLAASADEDEYIVWGALNAGISNLVSVLRNADDTTLLPRFNRYLIKILSPIGKKLGWEAKEGEDLQVAMLRALILGRLGRCGHEETIHIARKKFKDHIENRTELHPDLRLAIYTIIGQNDGEKGMEQLKKLYESVGFGEVERHCVVAMAQCQDEHLLKQFFKYAVEEKKVRAQDLMLLFYGARMTKVGQDFIWPYFKENTTTWLSCFGDVNSSLFQHCFKASCDEHCSAAIAKDVENYVHTALDECAARTLDRTTKQIIESIRLNEKLLKNNVDAISNYLKKNGF
uniref:Aminopeptidase n=1 Tax=Syphacia muris TaxID=451379 RepID=A0A158R5B1_9BILA